MRTNIETVLRASDYLTELWGVMAHVQLNSPGLLSRNFSVALSACEVSIINSHRLPNHRYLGATLLAGIDEAILPAELKYFSKFNPLCCPVLVEVGEIANQLSQVHRLTRYPNGTNEDDLAHSVNLALYVLGMAESIAPKDQSPQKVGSAVLFALVHDTPEIESGDEVSLGMNATQMNEKKQRDKLALEALMKKYGHLAVLSGYLTEYETQHTRDAKIVYIADKTLPAASHESNNGVALLSFGDRYDSPVKYFGGAISETTKKIAKPKYAGLPLWQSVYNEIRARAGVATYGMDIQSARKLLSVTTQEHGLVVPEEWVVV